MRILSQDGRTDIPYELFVFGTTKDNCIIAIRDTIARPSEVAHGVVAKYTTEAKTLKAMEMLREKYKETLLDYRTIPKIFQFPSDEEIEV